jgi:hypothetical protein
MDKNYYMIYFLDSIMEDIMNNNIKLTKSELKNHILNKYLTDIIPKIKPTYEIEQNDKQLIDLCVDYYYLGNKLGNNIL